MECIVCTKEIASDDYAVTQGGAPMHWSCVDTYMADVDRYEAGDDED